MTTIHELHTFYAGDDWQIDGSLFDVDGNPLDVTGATLEWALLDFTHAVVLDESVAQVEIIDAVNGKITIVVPDGATEGLPAGQYSDVLRVTLRTVTDTMWTGAIIVKRGLP